MKYLGIDYGTKRIGIALSDGEGRVAFPHSVIAAGPESLSQVHALCMALGIEKIIMGESRTLAGERNPVQEDIEQFKKDLEELTGLPVEVEPEFFTSALAARQFAPEAKSPSGPGRPRASRKAHPSQEKLDASAAALILQSFLDKLDR